MSQIDATTKSELQLRWVILVMATITIVLSFVLKVAGTELVYIPGFKLPLPESCGARVLFGIDCPACGLTRAFISISHGNFYHAWRFNPASFLTYLFVAIQIPWQLYQLRRVKKNQRRIDQFWIYILPMVVLAAMLTQWVYRLSV